MAIKTVFIFLLATLMAISVADSQSRLGIVHVNGTLYCTSDGSNAIANNPPVFPDATVKVVCSKDVIAYSPPNTTTDSNGVYLEKLILSPNATASSIVSSCRLFVLTPLSACNSMLPSAGLVSNLRFVKRVPVQFLYINYLAATGFTPQP